MATQKDKDYWKKLAASSAELEKETHEASPQQRLAMINFLRTEFGIEVQPDDEEWPPPEVGFYEIARSRGMLRRPHTGP